ncbi:MAG: carbohydrate ABC transporter permease [Firmicutes bacterium]|nr:carbohydrate ABC transporter permease [Bacillota bacterium]
MDAAKEKKVKVKKSSKNSMKVEFEGQLSTWERIKIKVLSLTFWKNILLKICLYVFLIGIAYIVIYPFISKVSSSFMSADDFVDATVLYIPKNPTLDTYKAIITDNDYFTALLNTFILSFSTAIIQMFITCLIGYGFAKFKFRGNGVLFLFVILTMIVPNETLHLAMFMKFRYFDIGFEFGEGIKIGLFNLLGGGVLEWLAILDFTSVQLNNTYWPFIILSVCGVGFKNGLYIFLFRQFFRGVPDELEESAYIDGAGTFKTFLRVIIPLSTAMLVTVFVFAFSWQWTDNYYVNVFFTTSGPYTLKDIITVPSSLDTTYAGENMYVAAIRNTCGILIMMPLVIMYAFLQKYLVQGIERSGIVG